MLKCRLDPFGTTQSNYTTDTNMLSSFSSLTTVTALSFQSSMLCADLPELTINVVAKFKKKL